MTPGIRCESSEPDYRNSGNNWHSGPKAGDKTFKVHLDGYNFKPFFDGQVAKGPRHEIFYFDVNLRQDPFERYAAESMMYMEWMSAKGWAFLPAQGRGT